jgi:heat shock protein HslJ
MRSFPQIVGLTSILVILAACGVLQSTPTPVTSATASTLEGTEWVLISLNGKSIIEGASITLSFAEVFLGGFMGCNGYGGGPDSGKFIVTDDGTLTIPHQIAVTVQLCSTPEGVMEQEAAYIEVLRSVASYRVVDDLLEIDNAAGETTLVFARRE